MTEKFGKGITYLREKSDYSQKNSNESNIKEVLNTIEKIKKYFNENIIEQIKLQGHFIDYYKIVIF